MEQDLLFCQVEDPLLQTDLTVSDVASAVFALKNASTNFFAVVYMRERMAKELARTRLEITLQEIALVQPFVAQTDAQGRPIVLRELPNPLPETVPQSVVAAIDFLENQYQLDVERQNAEFVENSVPLNAATEDLLVKVKDWFKGECDAEADWLGGKNSVTLAGCTVTYLGGDNFNFNFVDISYD